MNVTNDYEPPPWLVRPDRRANLRRALAVTHVAKGAARSLDDTGAADDLEALAGQVTLACGVLTFVGGKTLDLAALLRERDELRLQSTE